MMKEVANSDSTWNIFEGTAKGFPGRVDLAFRRVALRMTTKNFVLNIEDNTN